MIGSNAHHKHICLNYRWVPGVQYWRDVWRISGDLLLRVHQVQLLQLIHNYKHTHTTTRWHGMEGSKTSLMCQLTHMIVLEELWHIMIGEPSVATTRTITTKVAEEPPWSKLYEKRCELEVYCRWHGLRVPKARSAELPIENIAKILDLIERENNQMQQRLDHYHAIQKARKHLKGKGPINSINEISNLASDNEISDFQIQAMMIFRNMRPCC